MTKFYEEFIRAEIDELEQFELNLKGELTIVISDKINNKKASDNLDESDKRLINKMINKLSIQEISSLINQNKRIPRKIIYNYCVKMKK